MTEKPVSQVNQEFVIYEDGSFALFIDTDNLESFREKWVKYRELIDFWVGMVEEAQKLEVDFQNVSECAVYLQCEKERLEEENKQLKTVQKEVLKILKQNGEYQCYIENGLIPCKANCARQLEETFKQLSAVLEDKGEKK